MAHGGSEHGGIESITLPIGPISGMGIIGAVAGAIWLAIKHPGLALRTVFVGAILGTLIGLTGSDIATMNPVITLLIIIGGVWLVTGKST